MNRREFGYRLAGAGALLSGMGDGCSMASPEDAETLPRERTAGHAGAEPADYRKAALPVEQRVTDLLRRMTFAEKVEQISGGFRYRGLLDTTGKFSGQDPAKLFRQLFNMNGHMSARDRAILRNAIQRYQVEKTRLGIPLLFIGEGLHGFMENGSTSFPQAIGLASTWDPDLAEEVFTAVSAEMPSVGVRQAFAPVVHIGREPRWGRTEESFGEDPHLISHMGVAAVYGFQGHNFMIDNHHVLSTLKHFVAYGEPQGGRNDAPANYSERVLRENFFVAYEAAVEEARAGCVMASYNEINGGVPCHVNKWLLTRVLRQEWGFQGYVTSDGGALEMLVSFHHVAADFAEAARLALAAGVDFDLSNGAVYHTLEEQVKNGTVAETDLNAAVGRILAAKFRLGLFENPYCDPDYAAKITSCPAHQVSILQGITTRVGTEATVLFEEGCDISNAQQGWQAFYQNNVVLPSPESQIPKIKAAVEAVRKADAVILVLGENESTCREAWSDQHLGDRDSLDLLGSQNELIKAVLEAGKATVLLLINGRPLSINYASAHVPAILEGWYLGQEGGTAAARVIFGDVNPGGKLPITFPRSVGELPCYYNHKPSRERPYLFTEKGPLFPFGWGLSYTTFEFSHLRVSPATIAPEGEAAVSVE